MPTFDQSVASRLAVGEVLGESSEGVAGPVDLSGAFAQVISYSGDVGVARPSATGVVLWLNFPSEPTNMIEGDLWLDLTADGALEVPKYPEVVTGTYLSVPDMVTAGFSTGVVDRIYMTKVALPSGSIDRLAVEVTTAAAAGGTGRIGIWKSDPATGAAGDLVVDSGAINTETPTGIKEATVAATLVAGWHWVGFVSQGQICSIRGSSNFSYGGVTKSALSLSATAGRLVSGVSGALASAPALAGNSTVAPLIHMRWA